MAVNDDLNDPDKYDAQFTPRGLEYMKRIVQEAIRREIMPPNSTHKDLTGKVHEMIGFRSLDRIWQELRSEEDLRYFESDRLRRAIYFGILQKEATLTDLSDDVRDKLAKVYDLHHAIAMGYLPRDSKPGALTPEIELRMLKDGKYVSHNPDNEVIEFRIMPDSLR